MHALYASVFFADLSSVRFPSFFYVVDLRRRRVVQKFAALNLVGCSETLRIGNCYKGIVRRCKDWDFEGDFSLEAEILEFMNGSKNPNAFPSKRELIDSGRLDLVDAITKKGGWLTLGWDLDEVNEGVGEVLVRDEDLLAKNACDGENMGSEIESKEIGGSGQDLSSANNSEAAPSPGRSVEIAEQSGIEGILNRLEKERNSILGIGISHTEDSVSPGDSEDKGESHRINSVAADHDKSTKPSSVSSNRSPFDGFLGKFNQNRSVTGDHDLRNSLQPDMWRSWVIQRNGSSFENFEDAEITPSVNCQGGGANVSRNDIPKITQFSDKTINREGDSIPFSGKANFKEIKSRVQQLESELSSVLQSLRSGADDVEVQTGWESSSDDLQNLSDAWEFQENEIFKAKEKLHSIHAKLAVLEGKMTMAIMDANLKVKEKQKRIDNANRALRFLKTTCVVWPNSASEVLLAGSFDGWSSKRKMEKSNTGIFSTYLQLYPGKYEIKFIVDGEWKIDPLRPVVYNDGYENNLLIIQE